MLADTVWVRKALPSNSKQMARNLRTAEMYPAYLLPPACSTTATRRRRRSAAALSPAASAR